MHKQIPYTGQIFLPLNSKPSLSTLYHPIPVLLCSCDRKLNSLRDWRLQSSLLLYLTHFYLVPLQRRSGNLFENASEIFLRGQIRLNLQHLEATGSRISCCLQGRANEILVQLKNRIFLGQLLEMTNYPNTSNKRNFFFQRNYYHL